MVSDKNKSSKLGFGGTLVLVLFLSLVVVVIIKSWPVSPPPSALMVQKNPMPDNWGPLDVAHYRSPEDKKNAAIAVVYNEMLSRIETLLNLPTTLPNGTVVVDSAKYLQQVYGSVDAVPIDVYRVACLRIYNEGSDLKDQYKGKSKDFEPALYQVIDEYYYQGKPPASISISSVEAYHQAHQKKKSKKS